MLTDHLRNNGYEVISISMLGLEVKPTGFNPIQFHGFWKKQTKKTWSEYFNCMSRTIVLIDEGQMLYKGVDFIWQNLKALRQGNNNNLHLLLLYMYGYHPGGYWAGRNHTAEKRTS